MMVGVVAAVVDAKWTGTGLKTRGRSLEQRYHSTNLRDETNRKNELIKRKDLLDVGFGTCVRALACLCAFVRRWKILFFPTHHINLTTHVERRQNSAAYAAAAAVRRICAGVCVCVGWCYQAFSV